MLTIFSCPKPFQGRINTIQRNAIGSWILLEPKPEIILIGNEQGTAEICREFNLHHVPDVERNEYGTPLVNSVWQVAQSAAGTGVMMYVNTDIILLSDFMRAVEGIRTVLNGSNFLLFGGRWNVDDAPIAFDGDNWEDKLKKFVKQHGWLDNRIAMDYFVFPRNIDWKLPPFSLGRQSWDSWFPYRAAKMSVPAIDISDCVTAIHQNHDYSHFQSRRGISPQNPEVSYNFRLLGFGRRYTILDASHKLVGKELISQKSIVRFLVERSREIPLWMMYFVRRTHPYSYPLYLLFKGVKMSQSIFCRPSTTRH